jgi:glutamate synthase domain-containing protein 1
MCGIVGLFAKSPDVELRLGALLGEMLGQLADRGPDSAGIALYREPAALGSTKLSLFSADPDEDWSALGGDATVHASHAVVELEGTADAVVARVRERFPHLRVMSAGDRIEIFKEAGDPRDFVERFDLRSMAGSHGLGHTRMATESRVTTEGAHPFSTGLDLCLVHNGSLSNHNRLRRMLRREGIAFQTENDTEVAAGFLEWRLREGDALPAALERCLVELDGFYTFAVGTADGFAVLRDPIACKPAVMAENDDWVAMASEYRAIAVLPGADAAEVWEPEPARVYSWERPRQSRSVAVGEASGRDRI